VPDAPPEADVSGGFASDAPYELIQQRPWLSDAALRDADI
jgi:hypothetical protein